MTKQYSGLLNTPMYWVAADVLEEAPEDVRQTFQVLELWYELVGLNLLAEHYGVTMPAVAQRNGELKFDERGLLALLLCLARDHVPYFTRDQRPPHRQQNSEGNILCIGRIEALKRQHGTYRLAYEKYAEEKRIGGADPAETVRARETNAFRTFKGHSKLDLSREEIRDLCYRIWRVAEENSG